MNELLFIPTIGLLGIISTIISSKGSLYDLRYKWYKRLTTRGWIVSFLGVTILILSVLQFVSTKREEALKEKILLLERKKSDSIITTAIAKGVDSSQKKLFSDLSEAFSKQNLRIDTVTRSIEKLRDSAKTVILNYPKEKPIILIETNGIYLTNVTDSTFDVNIEMISKQAPCILVNLKYFLEVNFTDGSNNYSEKSIDAPIRFPKDIYNQRSVNFRLKKKVSSINLGLLGRYTSDDGSGNYTLQDVYEYSSLRKTATLLDKLEKDQFLKKYKLRWP